MGKYTMVQYFREIDGYRKREARGLEGHRLVAFTVYSSTVESEKRCEIYDFFPLYTDPPEATRKKAREKADRDFERSALKMTQDFIDKGYFPKPQKNG